ncbi:related to oxidoreductase [Ramularia collo-cygni]|uniref:Related to oxidoreductase n=1 Tax=Ramularia collo-cygni TaxID=112498 RepID=A0A2D3V164_9PEZI|nr:related to oxidoreductase [Ramularia collo-cygni]CZT18387.1 related to oxidoreductase [Ramularia collo-cygni]
MAAIIALAGGIAAWTLSLASASQGLTNYEVNFESELLASLSSPEQLCSPGSACYENATTRWLSDWGIPHFDIIVRPTTQEDVESAIRVANKYNKPFLAISGGHGATLTLSKLENGVGIWMDALKNVTINGSTARIGGGITSGELRDELAKLGKQSTTGGCDCTGAVAPMLGGGHGWLQGRYGLMADNLISANLVLANGSCVTVSKSSHPELFWALRGAGHNFGIVVDFEYRIYDITEENAAWSYEKLYYSLDRLEDVLDVVNGMIGTIDEPAPVELIVFGLVGRNPSVARGELTLVIYLIWQGAAIPAAFAEPFNAIPTLSIVAETTDLPGVTALLGWTNDDGPCNTNSPTLQRFPVALKTYPIPGIRAAVDLLDSMPVEFNNSALILEGYSTNAVQAVPKENTAYPDRLNNLLIAPFIRHAANDAELEKFGSDYGNEMRQLIVDASGQGLNAYANYAHGSETQQKLYGHETWRLEKLRKLKREWDPENRFGWYLAIEI